MAPAAVRRVVAATVAVAVAVAAAVRLPLAAGPAPEKAVCCGGADGIWFAAAAAAAALMVGLVCEMVDCLVAFPR
jgi:hypothetical protein